MTKNTMNTLASVDTTYHGTPYVWDAYPERWALLVDEGKMKDDIEVVTAAKQACSARQLRERAEQLFANADAALKESPHSEVVTNNRLADALLATIALEETQRQELRANLMFRKALLVKSSDFHVTH
jgi:Mg-chelatase subunit ChlI